MKDQEQLCMILRKQQENQGMDLQIDHFEQVYPHKELKVGYLQM